MPLDHAAADEAVVQKKSLTAAEQTRPDVAAARDSFFAEQLKDVPLQDVVVLDESYATTKFTPLRGRCRRGTRLIARIPHGHWKLLSILAAISTAGVLAAASIDAATDTDVFVGFIQDALIPALRPGQVVVMDNLAAHHAAIVQRLIEQAGCRLVYLPPYSPDLSPIEPMWSQLKSYIRSDNPRTIPTLQTTIGNAFQQITAADCQAYFEQCGYTLHLK